MEAPPQPPPPRPTAGTRVLTLLVVLLVFGIPLAACVWGVRMQRRTQRETALNESLTQIGVYCAAYRARYKEYPAGEEAFVKFVRDMPNVDAEKLMSCPHCGGRLQVLSGVGEGSSGEPDRPLIYHECPVSGGRYVTGMPDRVEVVQPGFKPK